MNKAELLAKMGKLRSEAKAIADGARAEGKEMTDAQLAAVNAKLDEAEKVKAEISALDLRDQTAARLAAANEETAAPARPRTASAQPEAAGPAVTRQADRAEADPARGFKGPREFFKAVMDVGMHKAADPRLKPLATAGSDENRGDQANLGGFLIPESFSPNLLQVATESDPTVGRVMSVPMQTPILKIPARTDKNHTSSVSGGLTFSRRSETGQASGSKISVEQVELKASPLIALNYTTEELLSDSPSTVSALLANGFRDEYAATILNEKLHGNGSGQYLGVMNAPCLVSVSKETGQAPASIVLQNILKMRARCWGYSSAIWIANHDTFPQLAQLQLSVGTGGVAVYQPSAVEDRPDTLFGRPIFYSEFAKTLGAAGDLILGNWSQYLEGTLQGMNVQESIHIRFDYNERAFRATVRNDGQPWWRAALTVKQGSNSLSPFVSLATRA